MTEYDIFLPKSRNDGEPITESRFQSVKSALVEAFGGFTHFNQSSEGAWKVGSVTVKDDVTLVRVLDDGSSNFDMEAFKRRLEVLLDQHQILIVKRAVEVV